MLTQFQLYLRVGVACESLPSHFAQSSSRSLGIMSQLEERNQPSHGIHDPALCCLRGGAYLFLVVLDGLPRFGFAHSGLSTPPFPQSLRTSKSHHSFISSVTQGWSPLLGAFNSHTEPMSRHFHRTVYF